MRHYKYFDNILTHYEAIKALQVGGAMAPRFCTFQTSNRCNQKCVGCSFSGLLDNKLMDEAVHVDIVKQLLALGTVGFEFCGGGEPFMLPYLKTLMQIIADKGGYFGTITNGTLLTDELIKIIIQEGTYIRISLEASNETMYVNYKNVPAFHWHSALRNIRKLVEQKRLTKSKCDISLKFDVSKTLCGEKHIRDAVELGNILGVDTIQIKSIRYNNEELSRSDRVILREAAQEAAYYSDVVVINSILPERQPVPQCWLNPLHTVIDHLGDVYLCCYYYYRQDEHRIGNVLEKRFEDIWFSEEHWDKIKRIDKKLCSAVDCKFFQHHVIINEAFENGRCEFL